MWRLRQAWLDLSRERRNAFLSGMGADLEAFTAAGITPVAMGETELLLEGAPWTFWAVWQAPPADAVRTFGGADDPHLISYFEQVRITGSTTDPPSLARAMADLPGPGHAD
ncbi:DUF6616 family protein [Streptomyces chartreusis]